MPTGPLGGPRPFAKSEVKYYIRSNVDSAIGERLENDKAREKAEKLIAQEIKDKTRIRDPAIGVYPAGWTVGIEVGTSTNSVPKELHGDILYVVEDAIESAIDTNATIGTVADESDWEIRV